MMLRWFCCCLLLLEIALAAAHDVVKRKTSKKKLYVLFKKETCVEVTSESVCPVSWKLPARYAVMYEYINKIRSLPDKEIINKECADALKAFDCVYRTPKCIGNGNIDFGDVKSLCESANNKCDSKEHMNCTNKINGTVKLSELDGWNCHNVNQSKLEGICSQPKYKIVDSNHDTYFTQQGKLYKSYESMKVASGEPMFGSECIRSIVQAWCSTDWYCSNDEKRVLVQSTREDCLRDIACFDKRVESLPEGIRTSMNKTWKTYKFRHDTLCLRLPEASKAVVESNATDKEKNQPPSGSARLSFIMPLFLFALPFMLKYF